MPDYPQTCRKKSKLMRMNIFYRSLWAEFARNGLLVSTILLGIVFVSQLIRLLGDAVSGRITVDAVLMLLGLTALNYMSILLSISLFISVLLTLSRAYRDSEMVVWHGAGIGLAHWIRPTLLYALPVVAIIALFSLVLSPWALSLADSYKKELANRDDVAAATPGIFRESRQANRIYFIENISTSSNRVGNIFVKSVKDGKQSIIVAAQGKRETLPTGERYLILFNGVRYEGVPGQLDYNIISFERFSMRIENSAPVKNNPRARAKSSWELVQDPSATNIAELQWRLSIPISAAILCLLALPLSYVNPRAGRSMNLIIAIVLYVIYNNLLGVTNNWIAHQKIHPLIGFAWIHLIMLAVSLLMLHQRTSLLSLKQRLLKRKPVES